MIFDLIALGVAVVAFGGAFSWTRGFFRSRLRFVDLAHGPAVPIVVGAGAAVLAAPVVALLPIVGAGTAIALGVGAGLGAKSGQNDRHLLGP